MNFNRATRTQRMLIHMYKSLGVDLGCRRYFSLRLWSSSHLSHVRWMTQLTTMQYPKQPLVYVAGYGARLICTYLASLVHVEWHKRSFERFAMLHPTPIKTLNYCTRRASHPSGLEAGSVSNVHNSVDSASWRTWSWDQLSCRQTENGC